GVVAHITDSELIGLLLDKNKSLNIPLSHNNGQWQLVIPVSHEMNKPYRYHIQFHQQGELLIGNVTIEPYDPINIITGGHFVASRDLNFDFHSYQPPIN
ncbi:MAG: hypothetical protein OEM02_16170, partial [Desulfobulbaceae bacterium]|nr:hypothetical protein [Desulfobulbaceae bacterium]